MLERFKFRDARIESQDARIESRWSRIQEAKFSKRTMLYSHLAIQIFTLSISACGAVFCNCLNCKVSKIYAACTVYVAFSPMFQDFHRWTVPLGNSLDVNRLFPSSKNSHFQNEARCTTFLVKVSFICMRMKNDFHIKGWAPTLVLKQRPGGTQKWPIKLVAVLCKSWWRLHLSFRWHASLNFLVCQASTSFV